MSVIYTLNNWRDWRKSKVHKPSRYLISSRIRHIWTRKMLTFILSKFTVAMFFVLSKFTVDLFLFCQNLRCTKFYFEHSEQIDNLVERANCKHGCSWVFTNEKSKINRYENVLIFLHILFIIIISQNKSLNFRKMTRIIISIVI